MKTFLFFFLMCSLSFSHQAQLVNQWLAISAGSFFSAGIKSDGTLWVWGSVPPDQGITISTPNQVGLDTNWMAVSCGTYHILLLKEDSTLWSMGSNEFGQLGIGNTLSAFSPQLLDSTLKWEKIQAGSHHSAAIKNDGTLWTWGVNDKGQLGVGGFLNSPLPTQVQVSGICKSVALHTFHTLAIFDSGNGAKLYAWGENYSGQLGNGTTTSRSYFDCDLSAQANILENNTKELLLFPNPSSGKFTIEAPFQAGQSIELYNLNGQQVFKQVILSSGVNLTLEINLKPGMYLLKLLSQEGIQRAGSRVVVE